MQTIWESLEIKPEQFRSLGYSERLKLYSDWLCHGNEVKVWEFLGYTPFEFSKKIQDPVFRKKAFAEFADTGFKLKPMKTGMYVDGVLRQAMDSENASNLFDIYNACWGPDQENRLSHENQKRKTEGTLE